MEIARHARERWLLVGIVVLAVGVRLASMLAQGGPFAYLNDDDGAYFGASQALVHGVLPYRDFVLLHPPGSTVLYAPAAELGRLVGEARSFALARLLVVLAGAASAVLAYLVARRAGAVAAVTAGVLYAVWFSAVYVERTTLLEPLTNLAILAALALLGRPVISGRAALAAGACVGVATAVKVTNLASLLVVVVWVLVVAGRRRCLQALAGAGAAFVVLAGPVILSAPSDAWRMIVVDQSIRRSAGVHLERLAPMLGLLGHESWATVLGVVLWVAIAVGALVVARVYPWSRLWVALLAVNVVLLLVGGIYFKHYSAALAPLLVLVIGAATQVVVDAARRSTPTRRLTLLAGMGVLLAVVAAVQVRDVAVDRSGRGFPRAAVAQLLAGGRCVAADSATPLILTGVMGRNIGNGCPVVVDFTGQVYETRGESTYRGANQQFQQRAKEYLLSGDRIVLVRERLDLLDAATIAEMRTRPVLLERRNLLVLGAAGTP